MTGTATYLYALARSGAQPRSGLTGIGGAAVRVLDADGLCCVVSSVPLAEFAAEPLARNLEDLRWLERVAREHDTVVQAAAAAGPVLPLRLGAIYSDDDSTVHRVGEQRAAALVALEQVDAREEWGVKVYGRPSRPDGPVLQADRPASGVDYLRRRRAELDRDVLDAATAAADAEAVFDQLRPLAARALRHRPQDAALSGAARPMVLNAAFLVDRPRVARFQAEVRALADGRDEGAVIMTGPWPPYSFVTLEGE